MLFSIFAASTCTGIFLDCGFFLLLVGLDYILDTLLRLACFLLLTAANQKEPLTPKFKVKDEPKDEEAASSTLPQSSYVFNQESEASAPSAAKEKLKPQEAQANMMRQDISVKAASELLMKLSGMYLIIFNFLIFF